MSYIIRPFHLDELASLVDLMNRSYADFGTDSHVRAQQLTHWLEDSTFEAHVMTNADGRLIGGVFLSYDAADGTSWDEIVIEPEYRRADVIDALLAHAEARTLLRDGEQQSLAVCFYVSRTADDVIGLLKARGYEHTRSSYRMEIRLNESIDALIPAGIEIRAFDRAKDVQAAYEIFNRAFAGHFGFRVWPFEQWESSVLNFPGDDNSLWLIAWEGDQMVGFSFNRALLSKPGSAWVSQLGVLKSHRKRGIGEALLKSSFKRFQERGFTGAGLGVDASNETGAVRLYERAGMHVYLEFAYYRKVLRGDPAKLKE